MNAETTPEYESSRTKHAILHNEMRYKVGGKMGTARLLMIFIKISWVSKNIELYDKLLVRVHLCLARLVSRVVLVHTGETFLNQMSHEKLWTREMPAIHQNKNIFASMRLFNCVNNPYGGLLALHAGKGRRYAHFLFVKIRLLLWTLLCDHSACSFTNEKFTHGITSH